MAKVTRRTFLSTTMGAAGGVAAMGLIAGPSTLVEAAQNVAGASDGPLSSEPMTAYVRDAATGEISVMVGHREIVTRDPQLIRRLQRATR
ncbi:MAG TPA: hypothetical protein VND54_05765 [Candidatus Saccharimonadales bacterium]|nr:hypothetical protein [Candidatus Saccharimonadales bacterium]